MLARLLPDQKQRVPPMLNYRIRSKLYLHAPTREGTTDLGESRPMVMNDYKGGFSTKHRQLLASAFEDSHSQSAQPIASGATDPSTLQRSPSRLGKFKSTCFVRQTHARTRPSQIPSRVLRSSSDVDPLQVLDMKVTENIPNVVGKPRPRARREEVIANSLSTVSNEHHFQSQAGKDSISSSRHNRSSQSDLDDFAASRLNPVIIRGGSQPSLARTDVSQEYPTSMPVPKGIIPVRQPLQDVTGYRANSPMLASAARLAVRRSQKLGNDAEGFRVPSPDIYQRPSSTRLRYVL